MFMSPVVSPAANNYEKLRNTTEYVVTKIGAIEAELWLVEIKPEVSSCPVTGAIPSTITVKETRKFFERPNICTTPGRILGPLGSIDAVRYVKMLSTMIVRIQPASVVQVLLDRHNDDLQPTVAVNHFPIVSADEGTDTDVKFLKTSAVPPRIISKIDLTSDSSAGQKRSRPSEESSELSNRKSSVIDLTEL